MKVTKMVCGAGKALVSMAAGANDQALPGCPTGVALQLEVCVDKVS